MHPTSSMEEQLNPIAATHLLQHTLRSLCIHETSQWVYAVFWRILPRNYPPPKWDVPGGSFERTRGNRRNWILAWEDGFCNFPAFAMDHDDEAGARSSSSSYGSCLRGLQPELFFKMSHEIYNYGEGLIGKVAADHSHKWVFKEPHEHEMNLISTWNTPSDSYPRTWEGQFQSGIKTIALIAVREGVLQLGSIHKVIEDMSFVAQLRQKFSYLESLPGVLLPHPLSSSFPFQANSCNGTQESYPYHQGLPPPTEFHTQMSQQPMSITPSMSSLEALLSKLPSVEPSSSIPSSSFPFQPLQRPLELMSEGMIAKEEINVELDQEEGIDFAGKSSSSIPSYNLNIQKRNKEFWE